MTLTDADRVAIRDSVQRALAGTPPLPKETKQQLAFLLKGAAGRVRTI